MGLPPDGGSIISNSSVSAAAAAGPTTPSTRLIQIAESLRLEHQFLRVPFEHLKKTIRGNHRSVEKEVSVVLSGVADAADRSEGMSKEDAVTHLTSLVSRLQGLKRKVTNFYGPSSHSPFLVPLFTLLATN